MTCQPLNIDRLQLMAFSGADAITPAAAASAASAMSPLTATPAQSPCAPAAIIENGRNGDGWNAMIASRASRLPFPTQRARQRYIDRHSQPCSGDA